MIPLPNKTSSLITPKKTPLHQCLGVVLAGGLSSRMGVDKSALIRNNMSMLSYSKRLLTESGINNIVISGKTSSAVIQDTIINDIYQQAGPLGGIASIIQQCKPSALLILPVDLPLMTAAALQKLKNIGEISKQACFYEDNYLPLYLPVNAHVENFLQHAFISSEKSGKNNKTSNADKNEHKKSTKSGPSMRALLHQIPHKVLKSENKNALFNSNTPEQWKIAQSTFSTTQSPSILTDLPSRKHYV